MILPEQWQSLTYYRPEHFRHPEKLEWSVVLGADLLSLKLHKRGIVLSDYRLPSAQNPKSQHPLGRAIDLAFPGLSPLLVLEAIKNLGVFTGYGLYRNEKGAYSFHVDTRTDRTVLNPATWGGLISRTYDPLKGAVKQIAYVGLAQVAKMVSEFPLGLLVAGLTLPIIIKWLWRS